MEILKSGMDFVCYTVKPFYIRVLTALRGNLDMIAQHFQAEPVCGVCGRFKDPAMLVPAGLVRSQLAEVILESQRPVSGLRLLVPG